MNIQKTHRETIKETIKRLVDEKVRMTRERREYKLLTRGKVAEIDRLRFFSDIDSRRADFKHEIRHGLLLYGYVRGRDYKRLEAKVGDGNEPSASDICLFGDHHAELDFRTTDVQDWLDGAPSQHQWKRSHDAEEAA